MKKILLLGAAALLSASAAWAGTTYTTGSVISDKSQLTTGYYFMHVFRHGNSETPNATGYVYGNSSVDGCASYGATDRQDIPSAGTPNENLIWYIEVNDKVENVDGTDVTIKEFTIQNFGTKQYFSVSGTNPDGANMARANVRSTSGPDGDYDVATYKLVDIPTDWEYYIDRDTHSRFFIQTTNALFPGSTASNPIHPYFYSNGTTATGQTLSYWQRVQQTTVQVEFISAVRRDEDPLNVTVHFPKINGWDVPDATLQLYVDDDASIEINKQIESYGGISNVAIAEASTIVSESNKEFTVTGTWNRELIPGHIYRMLLKPNDSPAAMRYDSVNKNMPTTNDANFNSLSYLAPERLWYFKEVEGKTGVYTLHNLYDPEKGVYIADAAYVAATLSDDEHPATEFTIGSTTWADRQPGDFYLSYGNEAQKNYLNDRGLPEAGGSGGYLCCWKSDAAKGGPGSAFRLYPILAEDLETLGAPAETEPTYENLATYISAFNDVNTDAALRRIRYYLSGGVGNCVGQYNSADGTAAEMYQTAVAIANNTYEADDEEKAKIVAALDFNNLIKNQLIYGRFYRFKNRVSGLYISSLSSNTIGSRSYMDLTDDNTRSNTIFYLDKQGDDNLTIVSYENGHVMPSFNGTNWTLVKKTDSDAAVGTKLVDQNNGYFIIHVSGTDDAEIPHRHLYGAAKTQNNSKIVDVANENTTNEYQWQIEIVSELPITLYNLVDIPGYDNDGWASVYSPVALEVTADSHLSAYTGEFDGTDYSATEDINHVLATELPTVDGKVIIPANQPTLLFYDGEGSPEGSLVAGRDHISYISLPIVYDAEATDEVAGNLKGSIYAFDPEDGMEYYTLHETHSNNFREYLSWNKKKYNVIPGFKAYIENTPDNVSEYPICLMNPNTMVPVKGEENFTLEKTGEAGGIHKVTIVMPDEKYTVYHKETPIEAEETPASAPAMHRVIPQAKPEFKAADKDGVNHTFTVAAGNKVEYYAVHENGTEGAVRTFTIDPEDNTNGIDEIIVVNGSVKAYDLQGRKLAAPAKGINIVNGKKMLVK